MKIHDILAGTLQGKGKVSDMWPLIHIPKDKPIEAMPWVTVPAHEPKKKKKKKAQDQNELEEERGSKMK